MSFKKGFLKQTNHTFYSTFYGLKQQITSPLFLHVREWSASVSWKHRNWLPRTTTWKVSWPACPTPTPYWGSALRLSPPNTWTTQTRPSGTRCTRWVLVQGVQVFKDSFTQSFHFVVYLRRRTVAVWGIFSFIHSFHTNPVVSPHVCVCPMRQVIVHEVPGQELEVEVYDKDPDQDDFLGRYINIVHVSAVSTLTNTSSPFISFISHSPLVESTCLNLKAYTTFILFTGSFIVLILLCLPSVSM